MKFQNKLQFFFLILALAVFAGQGLIHPLFHSHQQAGATYSRYRTGQKELKRAERLSKNVSVESSCPICGSVTHKTTKTADIQAELIGCENSNYSQSCESFSFYFHIKPVSRGPPCV